MQDSLPHQLSLSQLFDEQTLFAEAAKAVEEAVATASQTAAAVGEAVETISKTTVQVTQPFVEQATEGAGRTLSSLSQNSVLQFLTDNLGADWVRTLLGEADIEKTQQAVTKLQLEYPRATPSEIAQRLIIQKALSAGGIGLATNVVPPVAIALLGLELAALSKMQAEMIYEIAAAYGLNLTADARRGEVAAMLALAIGSSGVFKGGLGIIEILPVVGAVYGAATNAGMFYTLGNIANRYYEAKSPAAV
ncbi:MAG: hypothetical protein ACFB4I_07585 [Cyanophyceae cyanobacterium]